ncbi:hypothetical protein, partial [Paraburkholderia ribeironis]|uniref:hypothetical protein n=2 Tax=Paraburkholderia TaxID=1822464 RepID=UPI001C3FEA07
SYFEPESSPPDDAEPEAAYASTQSDNDVDHTCPLSDRFVSEVGWRACWFVDVLGPALIDCLSRLTPFVAIESSSDWDERDWNNAKARRNDRVRKFLASYDWIDGENQKIVPPFQVELPNNGRHSRIAKTPWPPSNLTQLLGLASLAQTLHLFVVLLATAGRISEVLSLSSAHPPEMSSLGMSIEG